MRFLTRSLLAASLAAGCVLACGGAEFVAGSEEGGAGSSSGTDAAACVTPPAATGDEAPFCDLEAQLFTHCGQCEACRQTDLNNCVALGDDLSAAFKQALLACPTQIPCGDYSTYGSAPCVSANLATATRTSAQLAAASAYCTKCDATNLTCDNEFFQPPAPDGGTPGPGYTVLIANDAIAQSITTACTSCGALYALCAIDQFCKTQAPDACGSGYCGK